MAANSNIHRGVQTSEGKTKENLQQGKSSAQRQKAKRGQKTKGVHGTVFATHTLPLPQEELEVGHLHSFVCPPQLALTYLIFVTDSVGVKSLVSKKCELVCFVVKILNLVFLLVLKNLELVCFW